MSMTRVAAALAVGATLALAAVAPAGAAFPGTNGKIAFERKGSLWIAAADGNGAKRLVKGGSFPSFAPDGRRIAFQRTVADATHIWIVNADGKGLKQLTDGQGTDTRPSFSGDGKRIVFQRSIGGPQEALVVSAGGGKPKRLKLTAFDSGAQLSVTDRIVYGCTGASTNFELCAAAGNGSGSQQITDDIDAGFHVSPSWSPDGTRILFMAQPVAGFEVFVAQADGSSPTQLTDESAQNRSIDSDEAAFSPDGQLVVFESNRQNQDRNDVWVMQADGSGPKRLIKNGSAPDWGPAPW